MGTVVITGVILQGLLYGLMVLGVYLSLGFSIFLI